MHDGLTANAKWACNLEQKRKAEKETAEEAEKK